MKYKITLNNRVYEVEVEAGKAMLLDEYEVERERAEQDLDKFLETMKSYDMIDMMD